MEEDLAGRLAKNIKQLREARGMTQQHLSKLAGMPRATWANLESGAANPTLSVLYRVAGALQVPMEELIAPPRAACQFYPKGVLPRRTAGQVVVSKLLPDTVLGIDLERIEIPARGRLTGVPHTPGTKEYLTCEAGEIVLVAAGEEWKLGPGDVVVFRGDQRHSYTNPTDRPAVGYSTIILARVS